ncbi:MAG: M20/M25/M40 family metallo-hydrolase [Deltaproteobacteria bacterium]|nr:M20/M25/M40 family metallo-hydrolase [Nannocystaceae bacterium]
MSDDPVVQRIVELGRTDSKVHEHLRHLAEVIGPRLTGSHALMIAERWARDRFAAFGLTAKLERWGEIPVGFDRGPWSGGMVAPVAVPWVFITRAWTPGVLGPVRGKAAWYPSRAKEVTAAPQSFAGAWIVQPKPDAANAPVLDEAQRTAIDDALAAAGIAGYIERARDPKGELVHTGGNHKIEWAKLPRDVRVSLRGDQHDDLTRRMAAGEPVEIELSIDNRFFKGPVPQHNVVADLVGSELPDELVIVGGHLDSWDGARGAVDNGTGCATTLEAARLLVAAGAKPRRTIRFMLWGGEEQGLLGSEAYVAQHPELVERVSVVLVHDGGTNFLSGLQVTPEMAEDMLAVFAPVMQLDPELPFALRYTDALRKGGSDHSPFIDKGIPGFFWEQDGRADYDHSHHTQYDTLEFAIPEYQQHSAMVVAIAALGFANLDHKLDRTDSAALPRRQIGAELDGMKVTKLDKAGRAAKAGAKQGDEIVAVEGVAATSRRDVFRAVSSPGDKKTITVLRKRKRVELVLDFANDPADAEREARRARRKTRFGELDYDKPFAGRELPKPKPEVEPAPSPAAPK